MNLWFTIRVSLAHTAQSFHNDNQVLYPIRYGVFFTVMLLLLICSPLLAAPSPPSITAQAAIVVDAHAHQVFFVHNPFLRLPMASTTKVMTALLALEQSRLQKAVRISSVAASAPASKIYLRPGEIISIEDLLYAALLHSANDASVALAEAIGGSESNFARMMTRRARMLGAKNTKFMNASGLPDPDHYSTVWDLALLMKHALTNPRFVQISRTKTYVLDRASGLKRHVRNHNKLLWRFAGAGSGKTGYTRAAGHCYVGTATRNGRTLIVAVLKSRSLWSDVQRLLEYGFQLSNQQPSKQVTQRGKSKKTAMLGAGAQSDPALYILQAGAFRDKESAQSLRDRLQKAGHDSYILESTLADGTWYRVRIDTYGDMEEAKAYAQDLQERVIILPREN